MALIVSGDIRQAGELTELHLALSQGYRFRVLKAVPMIKVGIVGGTGYTGVELLRLLAVHPEVDLIAITSRAEAGIPVAEVFPNLRGHIDLRFSAPDQAALGICDLVFFATPNGTAMGMAGALLDSGVRVLDFAAGFLLE